MLAAEAAAAVDGEEEAVPVSPPPGPSPPRPSEDELFCSYQNCLEDVKIFSYDIAKGAPAYVGTLAGVRFRMLRLAPFRFHGTPVTPLIHPKTGYISHFIIRLWNSKKPTYMVDCLIRDSDLYFVGFRRHLKLTEEEEARLLQKETEKDASSLVMKKKKGKGKGKRGKEEEGKKKGGWGTWYRFTDSDMKIPEYFNAKPCGIGSAYQKEYATAGGFDAVEDVFFALATFQDKPNADPAFKKACYRFMIMFCEAARLRSVFRVTAIKFDENVTYEVPKYFWASINNWGQMGRDALGARLKGRDPDFNISKLHILVKDRELQILGDLVGHNGEVLLIRSKDTLMGYTAAEIEDIRMKACKTNSGPADCRDSRF